MAVYINTMKKTKIMKKKQRLLFLIQLKFLFEHFFRHNFLIIKMKKGESNGIYSDEGY